MKVNVQWLLWLALGLALAGSLKHLAAIFAGVDGNNVMGWLQAIAIDAGLFALAYSIRVRKAARRSIRPLWFGVSLFTAISIYGNLSYGLLAEGALPAWMIASKPYILAGSLPVLVLFLSELLSDDRQHAAAEAAKEARRAERNSVKNGGNTGEFAEINEEKRQTKAGKIKKLATLLQQQPHATNTALAKTLSVSRGTIRNYRAELNGTGK